MKRPEDETFVAFQNNSHCGVSVYVDIKGGTKTGPTAMNCALALDKNDEVTVGGFPSLSCAERERERKK